MDNDNGGYEIILEKNQKLMQVEGNANNRTRVSCQQKKRKTYQRFYFEVTNKTIPPQPPPPPPPPLTPVSENGIFFSRPNFHGIYNNKVSNY